MPLRERIEDAQSRLADESALQATVERLVANGELSAECAVFVRDAVPAQLHTSRYVLRHLGAHLAIGAIFAFDLVPLPLGTIARVSWVAGSRLIESARRNHERARIHSLRVFLVAAIPWFGYVAYLIALRRHSPELAFVLANHTWLGRTGHTYEAFLGAASFPVRVVGRWLVPEPGSLREHAARQSAAADEPQRGSIDP